MYTLGFRCGTKVYSFVILTGKKKNPQLVKKKTVKFPKNFTTGERLRWFCQEVDQILIEKKIEVIGIKKVEIRGRGYDERIENETIIYLSALNHSIKGVYKKVKRSIAKDLCSKGVAKLLETELDFSWFTGYKNESKEIQEATLIAWSLLL